MSRLYIGRAAVKDRILSIYHRKPLTFNIVKDVKEEMSETTLRAREVKCDRLSPRYPRSQIFALPL